MTQTNNILRDYLLLKELTDSEIQELEKLLQRKEYRAGDLIIEEHSLTDELYLLQEGQVEILKMKFEKQHIINVLEDKKIFGEMSFLDMKKRSSSVRAKTNVKVLSIARKSLDQLSSEFIYLKYKLPLLLSRTTMERLREINDKIIAEKDLRHRFANFVIMLIMGFCILIALIGFHKTIRKHIPIPLVAVLISFIMGCLSVIVSKLLRQPLSEFGVTLKNWRPTLLESATISAIIIGIFYLFYPEKRLLSMLWQNKAAWRYVIVVFVQEFVFRGVLQTAIQKFYEDDKGYFTIILSSLMFAITHVYYGFMITFLSFFMGLFLGVLYLRHKNLLGVGLVHLWLGYTASIIFGFGYFAQ